MANTFVQPGYKLDFTAGSTTTSGQVVVLTSGNSGMIGVAETDVANGAVGTAIISGVHTITALSADTGSIGTIVYWDAGNSRLTTTSTSNTLAGKLAVAKTNGQTTMTIILNMMPGGSC